MLYGAFCRHPGPSSESRSAFRSDCWPLPRRPGNDLLQSVQGRIKNLCDEIAEQEVEVSNQIVYGNPRHEILGIAESENVDMIVMGTHGRRGFSRFINGSVAEAVVSNALCSVLSVKHPQHDFIDSTDK